MLFDTDVLIWCLRGNQKAAKALQQADRRTISVVCYMELLQGAMNKNEIKLIRKFLNDADFEIIPLSENIGHRASVYMEMFCLRVKMCLADALLAATAIENNLPLYTGNTKHYKLIDELEIKPFYPE